MKQEIWHAQQILFKNGTLVKSYPILSRSKGSSSRKTRKTPKTPLRGK